MEFKEFTYVEFIDAIEQNGIEQAFSALFKGPRGGIIYSNSSPDRTIGYACAVGQAAYNLGVDAYYLQEEGYSSEYDIVITTIDLNDGQHMPLKEIAAKLRNIYSDRLNETLIAPIVDYSTVKVKKVK